ncbi:MAG: IMP cyclohydrolase [Candidatus Paceibacterota bacterium]
MIGNAIANYHCMARNTYPGRGIVVGRSEDGNHLVQVYWIMGRSPSSRNRRFVQDDKRVYTDTLDPAIERDPLTLFNAMNEYPQFFAVSNGAQTDRMLDYGVNNHLTASLSVHGHEFEPDAPSRVSKTKEPSSGFFVFERGDRKEALLTAEQMKMRGARKGVFHLLREGSGASV